MNPPSTSAQKVVYASTDRAFFEDVSQRVDAYFKERSLARTGDGAMWAKSALYLGAFWGVYALLVFGSVPALAAVLLCLLLGHLFAGIGFNVGHDAVHGATSRHRWVNALMSLSFDTLGASSKTWSVAHNFVHHTYTNIPGVDHDLDPGPFMKFHPTPRPAFIYRFQFLYMFVLYGFTTIIWILKKDFQQILTPDPRTGKRATAAEIFGVFAGKLFYAAVFIALPLAVVDRPAWQVFLGLFLVHFAAGASLALVFQLAHCVEGTAFPEPDADRRLHTDWASNQMRTTANFAGDSKLVTFLVGGLNHQIEHHLFPKICHVHYPAIAPIVKDAAQRHGLPYIENPTFFAALASHIRVMYRFGRPTPDATVPAWPIDSRSSSSVPMATPAAAA